MAVRLRDGAGVTKPGCARFATLCVVTVPPRNTPPGTLGRRAVTVLAPVLALVVSVLVLIGAADAAYAEAPRQWPATPSVSPLYVVLVLGGIPAGLFVVISLLVYLPSMRRGETYRPGQAWRGEPTWFGGPRGGVQAVEDQPSLPGRESGEPTGGGASGRW